MEKGSSRINESNTKIAVKIIPVGISPNAKLLENSSITLNPPNSRKARVIIVTQLF